MTDWKNSELSAENRQVTASVVIAAFTFDRWDQIVKAVDSVQAQSRKPAELILSIDRNPDLLRTCQDRWESEELPVPVKVVANHYAEAPRVVTEANSDGVARGYSGGGARNAGAESASGDVIVITDDDAWPEADWLEHLLAPYDDPTVVAVGGRPVPEFETERPTWFPRSFDWIFGCAYEGLPTELAPTPRMIGANMSVRSAAFKQLGGFKSADFDDLDLCTRLAFEFPDSSIQYQPLAVVHHFVPAKRVTWHYFWTRAFLVNRDKVPAFAAMGEAASMAAERRFVLNSIRNHSAAAVRDLASGRCQEFLQLGAMLLGIGLAALGNLAGWVQRRRARLAPAQLS
jgi:glucosyl-dolichyl phosphate glucuronosyltransferase